MDRILSLHQHQGITDQRITGETITEQEASSVETSSIESGGKSLESTSMLHVDFKIVSGGQTGVDQAALQVAIDLGIQHGGWCPKGRKCESGTIPDQFLLRETDSHRYAKRTKQNIIDSDATLIVFRGSLSGGTLLTQKLAIQFEKPHLMIDLLADPPVENISRWLATIGPKVLNIAGPRESTSTGIFDQSKAYLNKVFRNLKRHENKT